MTDDPNNQAQLDYPGDKAFAEFLERYECPLALNTVKFRLWGNVVSVAARVRPTEEFEDIWKRTLPEFEDGDEAGTFFAVMFSLWNALAELNLDGRRLPLSQRRGLDSADGLAAMIERRLDEIDRGFTSGFIGDMTFYDKMSERTDDCLSKLNDLTDKLEELGEEIENDATRYPEVRKRFLALDRTAQRLVDNLVKAANAERKFQGRDGGPA